MENKISETSKSSSSFPMKLTARVDGTDIIYTAYADRHVVIITQLNKIGSLVSVLTSKFTE